MDNDELDEFLREPSFKHTPDVAQARALARAKVALNIARIALADEGLYGTAEHRNIPVAALAAAIYRTPFLT